MGLQRTKTVKNKHAAKNSGIGKSKSARTSQSDGVVKSRKPSKGGKAPALQVKGRPTVADLLKKKKKKVYTDEQLGIPKLNMITPVGVEKPKGKKKGKVFVDDPESMNTILAMVQAEKEGQIESKMMKARQMEEIREARRIEAEKKEAGRQAVLDETKEALRKKRNRKKSGSGKSDGDDGGGGDNVGDVASTGTKAARAKPKKRVSFA